MKKIFSVVASILYISITVFSQEYTFNCVDINGYDEFKNLKHIEFKKTDDKFCEYKTIRVIIHFMLRSDGTGNFNEIDDGLGGSLNGYKFIEDIFSSLKLQHIQNPPLALPPYNGVITPNPKNYNIAIEEVLFHRVNANNLFTSPYYYENGSAMSQFAINNDSIINIFFAEGRNDNETSTSCAIDGGSYIGNNIIRIGSTHCLYRNFPIPAWYYPNNIAGLLAHEIGHVFDLLHTTRTPGGERLGVQNMAIPNIVDTLCSLYIFTEDDTYRDSLQKNNLYQTYSPIFDNPTPMQMYYEYGNTCHPACGRWLGDNSSTYWSQCSNNMMDYNDGLSLSNDQIKRIHYHLNHPQSKKPIRVCHKVTTNQAFCSFGFPKMSYYGDKIKIAACSTPTLVNDEKATVYFNTETVIGSDFEVLGAQTRNPYGIFEVRQECKCD